MPVTTATEEVVPGGTFRPKEGPVSVEPVRRRSKVKIFWTTKGFGFIYNPDNPEGGPDLFVHHENIRMPGFRDLTVGQTVEFEIRPGRKAGSLAAYQVEIIGD